jgi:enterochelin esterase family protein
MIVVMDNDYATYAEPNPAKPDPSESFLGPFMKSGVTAFGAVLVNELMPMIDSSYRTITDRDHRAIAGLSLGGAQAMAIGLAHLDLFSNIGTFSGAQFAWAHSASASSSPGFDPQTSYGGVFADAAGFNGKVHLLWMGAGTAEVAMSEALRVHAGELRAANIKVEEYHCPGTAHEWMTWRMCLNKFAPLLFQA